MNTNISELSIVSLDHQHYSSITPARLPRTNLLNINEVQQLKCCTAESYIKLTKATTIKLLNGKRDQWEHYIPWPNGLADYSKEKPTDSSEIADEKIINERYRFVQDVLIPAISKHIIDTQAADHAKFAKKHKVVESPYPIGSKVMIKNVNRQNNLDERRDIPTHQIVYNAAANPKPTSVDEFLHWKGFDDPIEHTWEPVENFDSTNHIELYWVRKGGSKATGKCRLAPKTVNWRKTAARKEKRSKQQTKRS
ncbi:hypothetical protein [Parasitella parasitica]|uniref:Chromo domain-containing protein n=1 Tax=Parasitella parasitica TaxID=35722 RepID=A0A0B7NCK3_9FUNG|nr:hypothetical protein [Parasitella parasitica]